MNDTKICPYCGEEIKFTAKKCRHCGEWLDETVKSQTPQSESLHQVDGAKGKSNLTKYFIIGICAIVVLIAIFFIFNSKTTEDNEIPTKVEDTNTVIPPADHPYSVDEIEQRINEYDANETAEEKAQEPWRIHLDKLQGSYLADVSSMAGDLDMVHNYGKYVISGNTLTKYEWDENSNSWTREFSSDFQLFKFQESGYMTGYNLIYIDQYGNECRMCSGDTNGDGVMDLWQSDSIFWTKQ